MAFITAEKIHDGYKWLPEGTIIEIADDGTIIALHGAEKKDEATVYEGVLVPGFVNAHCHLELSHMKGVIPEGLGLIPFLKHIPLHRNDFSDEQKKEARRKAYDELLNNGVVAVGDISNVNDTEDLRALDKLHIHTFVEAIGFTDVHAQKHFDNCVKVHDHFAAQKISEKILRQSIVPHTPYTVSRALFTLIDQHKNNAIISIHNQESESENTYYKNKQGSVPELLHLFNIDDSFFEPSVDSSLRTYADWISPKHPMIFVHNTFTKEADINIAQHRFPDAYWCLCPNANLYIEECLPNIDLFMKEGLNICIGTDSLSSNHQLSILAELQTIKEHFPQLSWETLINWATINGARALQMNDIVGSIETGKKPGIVQLCGLDNKTPMISRVF